MRILRVLCLICALAVILSFSAFADAPVITAQPQSIFLPAGTELPVQGNFSVLASGENLSYLWQYSNDGGNFWHDSSSTASFYTPTINNNTVNGQRLFRVIVSNDDGEVTSSVVSVTVGAYLMDSLPQMLSWISEVGYSIFDWVGQSCTYIVSEPLLLFTVGFLAAGACIALVSRLLARY